MQAFLRHNFSLYGLARAENRIRLLKAQSARSFRILCMDRGRKVKLREDVNRKLPIDRDARCKMKPDEIVSKSPHVRNSQRVERERKK